MKKQMSAAPQSDKKCDGNQLYHGKAKFKALFPSSLQGGTMEIQCLQCFSNVKCMYVCWGGGVI